MANIWTIEQRYSENWTVAKKIGDQEVTVGVLGTYSKALEAVAEVIKPWDEVRTPEGRFFVSGWQKDVAGIKTSE
jgi:hypothetical protein